MTLLEYTLRLLLLLLLLGRPPRGCGGYGAGGIDMVGRQAGR